MKIAQRIVIVLILSTKIYAQDAEKNWSLTPILNYEYLSFQEQRVHSPGEGVMVTKGDTNPLLIAGVYKQYFVQEDQDGYPDMYHNINVMVDKKFNRHLFLGLVVSESDKPFYGGWRSFIAGPAYGYEFIRNENLALTLGIGLGIGDFGIELPNGENLYAMPIPVIRFNVDTAYLDLFFEYLKKPVLTVTMLPDYRVRLVNTFTINQFRNMRDFLFDTRLMYHFFSNESKFGDFASAGIGIKNGAFGFPLAEEAKSYEVVYHSVYGMVDLSFLQIQSGYLFNGITIYDLERVQDIGDGFFLNIVAAWQF